MENGIQISLDQLIGGGIVGAIIAGIFAMVHILLNKKVRTPTDDEAARRAAIVERNEVVALYKAELENARTNYQSQLNAAKADITQLQKGLAAQVKKTEEQDEEIDILKSEALANEHYIYRCIGTIYRLGTADDIPKPPPTRIKLTHTGEHHHG